MHFFTVDENLYNREYASGGSNLKLPEISGLLFVIIAAHELQLIRKDSCRSLAPPPPLPPLAVLRLTPTFRSVRVSLAAPVYYSVNFSSSPRATPTT